MLDNLKYSSEEMQKRSKAFEAAEKMTREGNDADAERFYLSILESEPNNAYCMFKLGEIYNRKKEPSKSYQYHLKAFMADSHLAEMLTDKNHVSHNYVYREEKETELENCPLCGAKGTMHSCYNDVTNIDFIPGFNPIRVWMYCKKCEHIFARSYPSDLGGVLSNSQGSFHMKPNTAVLPIAGDIANRIRCHASGNKLLEIGVGAGEFAAMAKEYLFDVSGIEIRKAYADQVSRTLDIKVRTVDFMDYVPSERFDIISMGDVIEHLTDPIAAIRKVNSLLNENGVLWISTPNFNSAFSNIMKDQDPMWRVCEHLSYFSYRSLKKLLEENGFEILDYSSSKHYNGSMEILARKISGVDDRDNHSNNSPAAMRAGRLNLGCGNDIRDGWINLDITEHKGVDVVFDLDKCEDEPLPFDDNCIEEVYAGHIIEYIDKPLPLMQELHRICKPDAKALFKCFYGASDEATEDPAHARLYFLKSFGYFSQPYYWRADYGYRGDWLTEKITLLVEESKYKGKTREQIFDDINRKRNVVKEMIVELKALKPIREPKKELQTQPEIEIAFV